MPAAKAPWPRAAGSLPAIPSRRPRKSPSACRERLPEIGGIYIQMEDELASMAAILGASWGGVKAMTSTSGPGFSLMMENIGLGICTETPCVVCNVQRAGPEHRACRRWSAQGDMMQARWGSHGHYEIIALSPSSSPGDVRLHDPGLQPVRAVPAAVIILADEVVGHMNERVVIPPADEIEVVNRRKPTVPPRKVPALPARCRRRRAHGHCRRRLPHPRHRPDPRRARLPGDGRRAPRSR